MKAIIDLECTCDSPNFPRNEMEIIEIGAIVIDNDFNIIDQFDIFVKPTIHTQITAFCHELTSITQEDVDNGLELEQALTELQTFLSNNQVEKWYSWGFFDKNKILSEISNKELPSDKFSKFTEIKHENASNTFMFKRGLKNKKGVSKALAILKLDFIGRKHRAIDDVININQILKNM